VPAVDKKQRTKGNGKKTRLTDYVNLLQIDENTGYWYKCLFQTNGFATLEEVELESKNCRRDVAWAEAVQWQD
jgi:hypothetical protein